MEELCANAHNRRKVVQKTRARITPTLFSRGGHIGVIICLFIDQLCFRFQLFDFQSHASPNLRILRISAPPQQLFVFIQAFLRRLFRELRVLVEIRRPFALQRGFYFVSRVGEERVDVSLERRPLLRGMTRRERGGFRRWWCSSKMRLSSPPRRPTASRRRRMRAQHGSSSIAFACVERAHLPFSFL